MRKVLVMTSAALCVLAVPAFAAPGALHQEGRRAGALSLDIATLERALATDRSQAAGDGAMVVADDRDECDDRERRHVSRPHHCRGRHLERGQEGTRDPDDQDDRGRGRGPEPQEGQKGKRG